jgi:hypothetical protein
MRRKLLRPTAYWTMNYQVTPDGSTDKSMVCPLALVRRVTRYTKMLRGPWIQTETAVTSTECSSDKGGIQLKLVLLSSVVSALSRLKYFVCALKARALRCWSWYTCSTRVRLLDRNKDKELSIGVKVKLSMCLTNYALLHEGVWGSGCTDPHFLDLVTSWRWVVSVTHPPLYPRDQLDRKQCPVPIWTTWRSENSCPHWGSNSDPRVDQAVASRCTDCAILALKAYGEVDV